MGDMADQTVEESSGAQAAPEDSTRKANEALVADGEGANGEAAGQADAQGRGAEAGEQAREEKGGGGAVAGDGNAAEVAGDLDELVKTAAQRDEYLALAQRTQADFENYRKRVARESAAAHERGMIALAKELLPALDNLDRALEDAGRAGGTARGGAEDTEGGSEPPAPSSGEALAGEDEPLLAGVRLVRSELAAALARAGIESFSPLGESFDPALHEAMSTRPQSTGGAESGTVVEVYQPGYRLGESIIRPARVVVAA